MRVIIAAAAFLAATLAGASAQAPNCTALALNVSICVQAASAGYTGGSSNYNPASGCCAQQTALNNACGSLQTQLGAKFFLVDTNAQQAVLNAALSCPGASP